MSRHLTATRIISAKDLFSYIGNVLVAVDVSRHDASVVADCLTYANLSGVDSHGVVRLGHYVRRLQNGTIKTHPLISSEQKSPTIAVVDGGHGLGHVVAWYACRQAMRLASESGTGVIVIKNSSHFGAAGFYVKRMVSEGYIGISMTSTDALLIPFGGRKPFFGTNPIAIGFPTNGAPLILDMSTTSIPYGRVELAKTEGKSIPPDWGLDEKGHQTTDPSRVVGLRPIAGPKGSGLAMVIDIFCSILSGMPFGPYINKMYLELDQPRRLGHFVMAIDIEQIMPLDAFKQRLGEMIQELNEIPPAKGFRTVNYPGQIEGKTREHRAAEGIPIDPGLYEELVSLGKRFGVPFPGRSMSTPHP